MKTLLILGAGTGGTMAANRFAEVLDRNEWKIIIVDRDETHYYQPGFLFIPFGIYKTQDVIKPKRNFLPPSVEVIFSDIQIIEPDQNQVRLEKDNRLIHYDYLIIATGSQIKPEETEGMTGQGWYRNIFDFYTLPGAEALARFLRTWQGGRMVVSITEMPIKCPVAPLEFSFLADWYFTERGMRDKVEITYVTPLSGAFTKPRATIALSELLERKRIDVVADFNLSEVDHEQQRIRSYDGREVAYDLLVTIPTNMGADVIGRSGMGDELNFVPIHKHTLQSERWENVWVIGDAGNAPVSKAGSVAHFMLDTLVENVLRHMDGMEPLPQFDGHANCFIETGFNQGLLIDFNYEVEPLPGKYPLPGIGPFTLLQESPANHWGKMGFRWVYWNLLLNGSELPITSQMSMAGKLR